MKITYDNNLVSTGKSLSEYLVAIKSAIDSEIQAISEYDAILSMSGIATSAIEILKEIRNDEQDHLVLLRNLFDDEVDENSKRFESKEDTIES